MSDMSIFSRDHDDQLTLAAQGTEPSAGQLRKHARMLRPQARTRDDYALIAYLEREARRIERLQSGAIEIEHRGDHLWRFSSRRTDDDEFWKRQRNPRRDDEPTVYAASRTSGGPSDREREIEWMLSQVQLTDDERHARSEFMASSRDKERALVYHAKQQQRGHRDGHQAGYASSPAASKKRRHVDVQAPKYIDVQGTEGSPPLVDALCAPGTRIELAGIAYDSARIRNGRAQEAFYRAPKRVAGAVDHVRVQRAGKVICITFEPPDSWDTAFVRAQRTLPNATSRNAG